MGKFDIDGMLRRIGLASQPDPQRMRAMLAARRQFEVKPVSMDAVESGDVAPRVFDQFVSADSPGVQGFYVPRDIRAMRRYGVTQPTAFYVAGNRGVRRHEVMHGILDAARGSPELQAAVPWWARNAPFGGFTDELLARLASKQSGEFLDWPLGRYAPQGSFDRLAYGAAGPVQVIGRAVRDNPELSSAALGALATGGVLTAAAMGGEE